MTPAAQNTFVRAVLEADAHDPQPARLFDGFTEGDLE
jgi:hypothetical protein